MKKVFKTLLIVSMFFALAGLLMACDKKGDDGPLGKEDQAQVEALAEIFVNGGLLPEATATIRDHSEHLGEISISLYGALKSYSFNAIICETAEAAQKIVDDNSSSEDFYVRDGRAVLWSDNLGVLRQLRSQSLPANQPFKSAQLDAIRADVRKAIQALYLAQSAEVRLTNSYYSDVMGGIYTVADYSSSIRLEGNLHSYLWANYSSDRFQVDIAEKAIEKVQKLIEIGTYSASLPILWEPGFYMAQYADMPGLQFDVEDTSATVIGFRSRSEEAAVVIPATYMGKRVTAIAGSAFLDNPYILSVKIPYGVTDIGSYAFNGCEKLLKVFIPKSARTIGSAAFANCPELTIHCASDFALSSWSSNWNNGRPVVWGFEY